MIKNKFKVGDKVRVRTDLKPMEYDGVCFTNEMKTFLGREATIISKNILGYHLNIDSLYNFSGPMLEPLNKKKHFKSLPKDYTGTIEVENGFIVEKDILDEVEKEYLRAVIKPFRNRVKGIFLNVIGSKAYIIIELKNEYLLLPNFKLGTMYKCMEIHKVYTLEELGL